jgi:mannitol/fructose-specific phosphotransferase system IIA component (Ntr-type)
VINVSDIIDPSCVRLELGAGEKEGAIRELVRLLAGTGKLDGYKLERYVEELMERERVSSTGIGQGIAISHRLVAGARAIMMAVGRSVKGVPFDSVDGKPVHLLFLIMGPQGRHNEYLKILGKLSWHLNDRNFFESLMRAQGPSEVVALFKDRET